MNDLDLRLVRYFTVVAEHQNFGRAAAELHLAQPSLSRQIQRLEQRLGVLLFDRTPQGSRLTDAGKAFLPEAQTLLKAAHRAVMTARAHAQVERLTIGYVEDLIITPAVRELRRRHPQAEIETRHLDCRDLPSFADARVDVLVGRAPMPFPEEDLRKALLYNETRMLVVPVGHRLAGRASVTPEDLGDVRPLACPAAESVWGAYQLLGQAPLPAGPVVETFEDKLELVAEGHAIIVLPMGDGRSSLRADLVAIPLENAPLGEVVLASRADNANPLIRSFQAAAESHLAPVLDLA